MTDLEVRLSPFREAGLLDAVPTPWQVRQGELVMWPWVLSTDVTEEARYRGAPLGHPLLRQPVIFARVGLDHLRIGTGLGAHLDSVCAHLHFTWHRGMPVWDLQVVQTWPGGLAHLRRQTEALLAGTAPSVRRTRRLVGLVLPDPEDYYRRFLGPKGWIARAERFDYPTAAEVGAPVPEEFFSLVAFARWARRSFPERVRRRRLPGHVLGLATRRFREGRGFGWFDRGVRP